MVMFGILVTIAFGLIVLTTFARLFLTGSGKKKVSWYNPGGKMFTALSVSCSMALLVIATWIYF